MSTIQYRYSLIPWLVLLATTGCGPRLHPVYTGPGGSVSDDAAAAPATASTSPSPVREADPWPADPVVKYNVDRLNDYRRDAGVPPVRYDATLSAFALLGSKQLAEDHAPHAHFVAHYQGAPGFGDYASENQGTYSQSPTPPDAVAMARADVENILRGMFEEGAGGGHHDNMLNPRWTRVGVGIFVAGGAVFVTNDFTN